MKREEQIFEQILAQTSAEAKERMLEESCAGDPKLRQRIAELLVAHADAASLEFLQQTGRGPQLALGHCETRTVESPGALIGRYKLLEKLGEGGFGVVYMAEQREPVKRRVALKIIKVGMDTREVVARFEAERQALALMDHPNIAQVHDGGATETGRPYFVMELVRGIPLTDYCHQNHLEVEERLKLFLQVCHAVQHAHQKGIIHRDLKPSNILVTLHDGVPVPKVIDFGIAKATHQELTEKTLFTQFHQFIGTPSYMSPEQAELSGLDIDTRSDIYSLGVLLYELLAGKTPFDGQELLKAGLDEMRRTLREVEPLKPSMQLRRKRSALDASGQARIETQKSEIDGDLDLIVMKCLEKDRTHRYETADALASDIQRHLRHEPVAARPPSLAYQARKFVRRHRASVAVVALFFLLLLASTVASTTLALWAKREQGRAENNFSNALDLIADYRNLSRHDFLLRPEASSFRQEFLQVPGPFLDNFARQEGGNVQLRLRRGAAYRLQAENQGQLGNWSQAITNLQKAKRIFQSLALARPAWAEARRQWAETCASLGKFLRFTSQEWDAEANHREAIAVMERLAADFPGDPRNSSQLAGRRADLAVFLFDTGRLTEGNSLYGQALRELRELLAARPDFREGQWEFVRTVVRGESFLAWYETATPERTNTLALAHALSAASEQIKPLSPDERFLQAHLLSLQGEALRQLGRAELAEQSLTDASVCWEKLVTEFWYDSHYKVGEAGLYERLGLAQAALGRPAAAEEAFNKSAEILETLPVFLSKDPDTLEQLARTHLSRARYEAQSNRLAAAKKHFEAACQRQTELLAQDPARPRYRAPLARAWHELGDLLVQGGEPTAAAAAFRTAEEHYSHLTAALSGERYWQQRTDEIRSRLQQLRGSASPGAAIK